MREGVKEGNVRKPLACIHGIEPLQCRAYTRVLEMLVSSRRNIS